MRKVMILGVVLALAALPASAANTITRGIDVWETKGDGRTYTTLSLPPGFFCTGSASWSGTITLTGNPITTSPARVLGKTDTVIERLGDTTFDSNNVATVNAIVRAASFKSTAPITVSGCPGSAYWDVWVTAAPTQSPFLLTIRRPNSSATGGNFDATVKIAPRLVFVQRGTGGLTHTLDQAEVDFTTSGAEWTHQPGSGGVTYGNSIQIDTDADGTVDVTVPGTSNFAPGWTSVPQSGCSAPPCPVPIPHQAPQHLHFVLPPPPYCTSSTSGTTTTALESEQDTRQQQGVQQQTTQQQGISTQAVRCVAVAEPVEQHIPRTTTTTHTNTNTSIDNH